MTKENGPHTVGWNVWPDFEGSNSQATTDIDKTFWSARPELQHIHTFARARMASPWATLGVVLARVVAATPPWLVLPPTIGDYGSLNLFVGLVGPSGDGKGAATAAARAAVRITEPATQVPVGSGEGLAHVYMRREKGKQEWNTRSALISIAEIDTLTSLATRSSSTILPELRKAWSGEELGFSYADPSRRLPIEAHSYRMTLVAGIQPMRAEALFTDSDAGTPQRFLWLPVHDPDLPDELPAAPDALDWKWPHQPAFGKEHLVMEVCDQAVSEVRQARRERMRGEGDPLDGHRLYGQLKVAAALSVLAGRADISQDDWDLAMFTMTVSSRVRQKAQAELAADKADRARKRAEAMGIETEVAETKAMERKLARIGESILRGLQFAPTDVGMSDSEASQKLAGRDRKFYQDAVDQLVTAGKLQRTTQGRPGSMPTPGIRKIQDTGRTKGH